MSNSILPFDVNQYSIPERIAMIGEIWDSMADEATAIPLTDAQKAELDRRIAECEEHPEDLVPWPDIERRIFGEGK
ncbi:MAG: addiction module protein [Pirellulales bacterium]